MCSSELCRGDGNTLDGSCEFLLRLFELGLQLGGARLCSLCRGTVVEREALAVVGATQGGMQGFLCDLELEREIVGSRLRGARALLGVPPRTRSWVSARSSSAAIHASISRSVSAGGSSASGFDRLSSRAVCDPLGGVDSSLALPDRSLAS